MTNLRRHNSLLKPRPHHRLLPRLLTATPPLRSIRRLHYALLLPLVGILNKRFIESPRGGHWDGAGAGFGGRVGVAAWVCGGRRRVVDYYGVVMRGAVGHGGRGEFAGLWWVWRGVGAGIGESQAEEVVWETDARGGVHGCESIYWSVSKERRKVVGECNISVYVVGGG